MESADILDTYYTTINNDPKCRNIKSVERQAYQGETGDWNEHSREYHKRLSLATIPSASAFVSYLERNFDLTPKEFIKLLKLEIKLHKFALKHENLKNKVNKIKKCLFNRKYKLIISFKEMIPSNFVTMWIYWTKCKTLSYSLDTILLMLYDAFIVIYDLHNSRRCIYRTTVNSAAAPSLVIGSKLMPVFAYAESGIYSPKIFVVGYPDLKTITKLCDNTKGTYLGLNFSLRKVLTTVKAGYEKTGVRFVVWNWTKGEKLVVYDQDRSKNILADYTLFNWEESHGVGVILQRSTTYNHKCQLVYAINATVYKQKLYEKLTIFYKLENKFYQSFTPKDICIVSADIVYVLDERGDLYVLESVVSVTLKLKKKWTIIHKRPKCQVRLVSYRDGLLVFGPEGVLKRYYLDRYQEWHCSWWMDLYDANITNIMVLGSPQYLYLLCPFKGILRLNDDFSNNNSFKTVFQFEKEKIIDIIMIQPACEYVLAVCDRSNVLVLKVDTGKQITKISFPTKFDKFPYLSNPCFPYLIFISDRVGIFYIYDIKDYSSPFIAAKISIGPHRITNASFSNSGMLLSLWIGGINMKLVYWAVNTNKSYSDFKIILNLPSSDNSVDVCPYLTSSGKFYLLVMEKKKPKLSGNRVFIYKYPKKNLVGICILNNAYKKLHFTLQSLDYVFGSLQSNPNRFVKFSFNFKKIGKKIIIEQSKNNIGFLLPHEGEFDLFYSHDYTFSYGLEDGQFVALNSREEKIKRVFSGYLHRGTFVNYENNKFAGGGIRKCFGRKCGNFVIILAQNGTLTGHKFRRCRTEDSGDVISYRLDLIKQMELVPAESCMSVTLATKKYPLKKELLDTENIRNLKQKEQPVEKGSKWAHCYATQFSLIMVPNNLSPSSAYSSDIDDKSKTSVQKQFVIDEEDIALIRKGLRKELYKILCYLLALFRNYFHGGRLTLPFPLFIISRNDLKEFFRRIKDIEAHTGANIKRRIIRVMKEIISWVKVFREPFNNAQLIRGILNPEIKAWNVGTKISPKITNWRKLCERQWFKRKVLRCGYTLKVTFPINPKMQKEVKVKEETFPDISCLNTPEVLYVSSRTVGGFKESDMRTINKAIQDAAFLKNLRASLEFYAGESKAEGNCNVHQPLIDYNSLWEKLCTKDTYAAVNSFNNAINEAMKEDQAGIKKRKPPKDFLMNLLRLNQAQFYEIKDDLICPKCKKVPLYSNCTHKPKCYPCFHDLKCTLSKYVFPETIRVLRAPDVSPNIFCKPMRFIKYYRFILHPHVKCCSFDDTKGIEVSSKRTDQAKYKQLEPVKSEKPNLIKNALMITSKEREPPQQNFKIFSKETKSNQGDVIWDECLEELIRICSKSNDCELLLRKLFFKCSQRLFCDNDRQYLLLKSLKHLLKYTSFFPLHTYLALPWLRELVKEVTDLKGEQTGEYVKLLKLYPDILTYKKTEYHDPFKIPEWWDKTMEMIAGTRKYLNLKLAKVHVMATYENLFPKEEESNVNSDDSVDSEMAKSPADIICGYKKVPCHNIMDVGLNEEVYGYGETKVTKICPGTERLATRTYNDTFRKQFMGPLEEHFLLKWRNSNQLYNNPNLTMSLTRYDESKYMNPEKDDISICSAFENAPDCITKKQQGSVEMVPLYLDKGNIIFSPNEIYKIYNSKDNTETIVMPTENNYRVVPVTNMADPFVPVQPHHPETKYWRPFTLKWLLSMKKPLSPRLLAIVSRLVSHEIPSEIHDWFKTYVGLIAKIKRVIKNRMLNFDLKQINKLQYHEYTKIQKLVYPIKLIETAQWLALIIHKLSIINKDIIDSTEKVMSSFCGAEVYKKHPLRLPKGRYPIKGKPFDPRKAFELVVGPRFPNSADNSLTEELMKTSQLIYYPKMYEPQDDLRRFLAGPVNNTDYVLKILINRQILQMCASKAKIHKAPKDWFTWRPLQQGAPNWVMIITVALASKLLCCTLSNITRRLYKILRDSRKYICRKAAEQFLKKRVKVENIVERDYDQTEGQGFITNEEIEKMVWEQPDVTIDYTVPDNTIGKYSGTIPRNEANLMAWRKHEEEFLGKVKRKRWSEKLRMEHEIEEMLRADDTGLEMYLEQKRYWAEGFRVDPFRSGFPPIYDKNLRIFDSGGENKYEICPNRPIKAAPSEKKEIKEKKVKKNKEQNQRIKRRKELLFMKKLILDGPSARYTIINTYYSNRFEQFTPINSKDFTNIVMLTVENLSKERDRLLINLRTVKHHIINFMLLMHIKKEHIKKKLSYFCECDDYYTVFYKRKLKLIPDEKLNHLYELDDEDNLFYRNGKQKEKTDSSCDGIIQPNFEDDEPYLEKELTRIMGGTLKQNYLSSLKSPFLNPPSFHVKGEINARNKLKIETNLKKGIISEKERDLTVMEFKRQLGWFAVYKQWLKWSFDYSLAYHGVFQLLGIENAIKAEEIKLNSVQKMKWEIRKLICSMDKIRKSYLINTTEYLYVRTTILSDIQYFRHIHSQMIKLYQEIEKLNTSKEDLKIRILRENPYLKESTLDHLLSPKISIELLKNVSVQDLKNGYQFYFLKRKPVYHFYQLNTQIGKFYQQVRSLNDERLYPIMSIGLRRELIENRMKKQKLYYQIHTGQKKIEEFYDKVSRAFKYASSVLMDLKKLHLTCYRKLNLLKKVVSQKKLPVSVYRKQLDQPLWKLIKPYTESKDVSFVAIHCQKSHPKFDQMKVLHRFKETLLTDRLEDLFAIRKTLLTELKLQKLYITLLKAPAVRHLDGVNEDMVEHYKNYIKQVKDIGIPTQIKGYDKVLPKLHLGHLISNYLKFIKNRKCLEFEREMMKKKRMHTRLEVPPACAESKEADKESRKSKRAVINFGPLCWFVKGSWEITDFKQFFKTNKTHVPGDHVFSAKETKTCPLLEHSNKVYDFLRTLLVPFVPPPSPASSDQLPVEVKMIAAAQGETDDTAYQQDEIIFNYLRNQVEKFVKKLDESGRTLKDISPREMEINFRKWINFFPNWHIRVPLNIASVAEQASCSLLLRDFAKIQVQNLHGFLIKLIEKHSSQLENRNIDRVRSQEAFTEDENIMKKCVEHMSSLYPPLNFQEVTDEGSGAERNCSLSVYARFKNNLDYTLSEDQYLLILNLINEHIKKHNKSADVARGDCPHINIKEDLYKDWIAFAFEKIFLNPVQYIFIRSGERLIKMYDRTEKLVQLKYNETKELKSREMILWFLKEFRELERHFPGIHQAEQQANEIRIKIREPLLYKWTSLKRRLDKLREQNKRLEMTLANEKKRNFPLFGEEIVSMNEKLDKLLHD